mgnify:CR=1 FL=1
MTSILKTDEIQSQNGGSVVKMQTLKHPSASGNNLELASDGSTTITNGTLSAGTLSNDVTGKITQLTSQSHGGAATLSFDVPTTSKYVAVVFKALSEANNTNIFFRIGTGGTLVTSGYSGNSSSYSSGATPTGATYTNGLVIRTAGNAIELSGICHWYNVTGNNWVGNLQAARTNGSDVYFSTTHIQLSGAINIVGLMDDDGTFDGGDVNVFYSH